MFATAVRCGIFLVVAASIAAAEDVVDYTKQIKPVLRERCYSCHGALKQEANLRLDTATLAIKGGDSGPAIVAVDVDASRLLKRIAATEESERMPPEGEPLKPAEIAVIRAWITAGAKVPADEQPERDPREHWSFQSPKRPTVPTVTDAAWSQNPIDAFIAAKHRAQGLTPQKTAAKDVWLRRVTFDLIGLPPTPAERDAFLADNSPEAYDKVVTRLLDSPHYGERWGRHWMDIWRYSDWWGLGAEVRNSQKHIWHWRDWIIESLNTDKGYDQMVREMLAADELYPNDLDKLRASGFLARQYFKFNRTSWLDETVEHTAKSFLGLTFNCAKCHDHKYDPFSQVNYYQIRAIFEPYQVRTDAVPGEIDFEKDGIPRAFDCNLDAPTFLHIRGDDRNPDKNRMIEPAIPTFLLSTPLKIEPVTLPIDAVQPGMRVFIAEAHLKVARQKLVEAEAALVAAKKKLADAEETAKKPAPSPDVNNTPLVKDDFTAEKPNVWEMRSGQWEYVDGKLRQSQVGATRTALRLKLPPLENFEATLRYTPTGGEMWKSVGITFDVASEEQEILAYLSSYAGGSKAQVAYKNGPNYVYPDGGAQARKIELNQRHEMILRVRGTLVNVTVDGEHSVAYRLPIERKPGPIEIITFDAQADFHHFELKALPDSVTLVEAATPKGKPAEGPLPLEQSRVNVAIAEKHVATVTAQIAAIEAKAIADRQRLAVTDDAASRQAAARAEKIVTVAQANEDIARAELELLKAAMDKKADAEKKLAASKAALDTAQKSLEHPGETYTPLVGALKTLENNLESEESRRKPFPATSTGRRTALALWLTDRTNPLAARVAVNHLWNRHFGKPLVPTVFDFGRKGTPPTHPELLDWLAVEFMDHGWSMKHVHRLIVTSRTYRLSSSNSDVAETNLDRDPDNRFLWRMNPRRMEAQLVRDGLLALSGELDLTLGGPSIPVNQDSRRRSLYYVHSHNEHQKFLSTFDDANVLECYRRAESIVPQQALALENSPLATAAAEKIVARMGTTDDGEFIAAAHATILGVTPTSEEIAVCRTALAEWATLAQSAKQTDSQRHARNQLVQALLNHNDFVTIR